MTTCEFLACAYAVSFFGLQDRQKKYYFLKREMELQNKELQVESEWDDAPNQMSNSITSEAQVLGGDSAAVEDDNDLYAMDLGSSDDLDCSDEDDDFDYISEEDVQTSVDNLSYMDKLIIWSLQFNISKNALTALLKILPTEMNLPLTASTLLQKVMKHGDNELRTDDSYYHFDVKELVTERIRSGLRSVEEEGGSVKKLMKREAEMCGRELVTVSVNIDGLKLFNSARKSIWPIVCRVNESINQSPFVAGMYVGETKPSCLLKLLLPFIEQYLALKDDLTLNSVFYFVRILCFICDAPARALLKGCKSHAGYDACDYCRQHGHYMPEFRKIVYSDSVSELRSDEAFSRNEESGYQNQVSPLTGVVPMITSFPPEYMHLVNLGVVRRFMNLWCSEKRGNHRISASQLKGVSEEIVALSQQLPREFTRRPRHLNDVKTWKATEFRTFLLYQSPIVLKHVLSSEKYNHFLLLHFSIYSLCSDNWEHFLPTADACLKKFVSDISSIYGEENLVYNVHVLLHLTQFVKLFGNLDSWSAFWGESFLGVIRRHFRGHKHLLSQAVNRVREIHNCPFYSSKVVPHNLKDSRDSIYLTGLGVAVVTNIEDDNRCAANPMILLKDLYEFPLPSRRHDIGIYRKDDGQPLATYIRRKCVAYSCHENENHFMVFPLCSNEYHGNNC